MADEQTADKSAKQPQSQPQPQPQSRAAAASPPQPAPTAPADALIEVRKDGEAIRIHPATLDAHEAAGWRRS